VPVLVNNETVGKEPFIYMKKLIASAGLVSVGAAGLQAAYAPGLTPMETAKPWSIAASVRGFYDDNYNQAPSHPSTPGIPSAQSSSGFEISPTFKLNFPLEQTYLGVAYTYSLKYYLDRPTGKDDQYHILTLKADHRFSERYHVALDNTFIYASEPEIINSSGAITSGNRQNSDAVHNRARITATGQITETLGAQVGYENNWYEYLKNDALSATLDRLEHLFDIRGTWQAREHLTGFVGYKYGISDYISGKHLDNNPAEPLAETRDNTSHYFYVGADHAFSSQLNGSAEIGATYTKWDKSTPTASDWSPYADIRGTYTYLPGSFIQAGITHTRNATDVSSSLDQESTTFFASLTHRVTPRITGSLNGQYQHSVFNGGSLDGKGDDWVLLGLNIEYRINPNWATHIGYNLDHLNSDITDRSFTRNRIYGGVTANF
jgi:outer membrane scaffolding protein for murein synthesis (MipA/OmpV family)